MDKIGSCSYVSLISCRISTKHASVSRDCPYHDVLSDSASGGAHVMAFDGQDQVLVHAVQFLVYAQYIFSCVDVQFLACYMLSLSSAGWGRSTSHTIDVQSLLLLLQTVFSADTYTRSFMQMPKLTGTFHSPSGPSPHSTCYEFCRLMTRHSLYPCSIAFGVWILQQQLLSNWGCTCYGAHATQKANNALPSMFCNTAHHTCCVIRRCWLQGILLLS